MAWIVVLVIEGSWDLGEAGTEWAVFLIEDDGPHQLERVPDQEDSEEDSGE